MVEKNSMRRMVGTAALLAWLAFFCLNVHAVTLNVVDGSGTPLPVGYRWLVQEDTTYEVMPGVIDPYTLSLRLHTSYAPLVAKGHSDGGPVDITLASGKRYFVSVLPDAQHNIGGAPIADGQGAVTVTCQQEPLPTAQIAVFVFEDTSPLNNWPDVPAEHGLAGFKVTLVDAGGRFGMAGGQMMMDGFGNPLGTTYDDSGNMLMMGQGYFTTDDHGVVRIKNLAPGKYTAFVVPPAGESWIQTNTIEGGPGIDAWVKSNEPPFWREFAPNFYHVHFGFVRPTIDTSVLNGGYTVSGQIVNLHLARFPDWTFHPGDPFGAAWVGLSTVTGQMVYAQPADPEEGTFQIENVPPGEYQVVVWDANLDIIVGFHTVIVTDANVDMGPVMEFAWFGRMDHMVFLDHNENGFRDPEDEGLFNVPVNLRWRDGTIYQSMPTDLEGVAPFEEIFPFFHWQVAEVGYGQLKPTGATVIVDHGGEILPDQGWDWPSRDKLTPQPQYEADGVTPRINPNTGNNLSRTETGPFPYLLEAFQIFQGATSVIEWGKSSYDLVDVDNEPVGNFPGDEDVDHNGNGEFDASNGGIAGMAIYATTRAESDPRGAAAEVWEPGIPRVQIALYADYNNDKIIDDLNLDGEVTLADVDNYPFENFPGPEDVDRNFNGIFDFGDALNIAATDSWDDNPPTNAQGPRFEFLGVQPDCFDGLPNNNQVRPGVFDGGYWFGSYWRRTPEGELDVEVPGLPEGYYIVEAATPPGYEFQKEEDKNVDFGSEYVQSELKAPVLEWPTILVGDLREVPAELALFPGIPCKFAGEMRPLPDRKQVRLERGAHAPCDFFMFTEVPAAAQVVGLLLDDVANERNPLAPTFGEKYAPPWLPISFRDWTGQEITRTYSDQYGNYNALLPSTYSMNLPIPSGVSPNMLTIVLNSPGPILDTDPSSPSYGQYITDPFFNRKYGQIALTFQYMPATTTYLDTPIIRIGAFPNLDTFPVDIDLPNGTPVIWSVTGPNGGPYVDAAGQTLTIASAGMLDVPNPLYDGTPAQPKTIQRDYGFGNTAGTVTIGGKPLTNIAWSDGAISGKVASGTTTGELMITRANGKSAVMGVTVTVGPISGTVHNVYPTGKALATPIQDAIDAAQPGDLILVAPGMYEEMVIMWKPVQLQGWGAGSTIINAVRSPNDKLARWNQKIRELIESGEVELLAGQPLGFDEVSPLTFSNEEGPGIMVLGRNATVANGGYGPNPNARIDGLTVTGADVGGGIFVNAYARYLEISNNQIRTNRGIHGGGIRVGHPNLTYDTAQGPRYEYGHNEYIRIHHNHIAGNGGTQFAGGGVSLYMGCDHYEVTDNYIVGNFTYLNGGGIGHYGLNKDGLIQNNTIIFNQSFNQQLAADGGGVYIAGASALTLGGLSPGAGSVNIVGNVIQGNLAGAGYGGGIRLAEINGQDVEANPTLPDAWYKVSLFNNTIVNNVSGNAGGGISMLDTVNSVIVHNTIARNDSVGTAGTLFDPLPPSQSEPQPAGIVAHANSPALAAVLAAGGYKFGEPLAEFSNPVLMNNILWQNRSFYFYMDDAMDPPFGLLPEPGDPMYWDLAVLGVAEPSALNPMNCVLTNKSGYDDSNTSGNPKFVSAYFNGAPGDIFTNPGVPAPMETTPATDEGGNFNDVLYGPLTLENPNTGLRFGDYHIQSGSSARELGNYDVVVLFDELDRDVDGELRPNGDADAGMDEYYVPVAPGQVQNGAPRAEDDWFTIRRRPIMSWVVVSAPGVLVNDSDVNGNKLTPVLVDDTQNGSVTFNSNGSFIYLTLFFSGEDTFTYKLTDGVNESNVATVHLNITTAGNSRPTGVADTYTVVQDTTLIVDTPGVLGNDNETNGDTMQARLQSANGVVHGTLIFNFNGSFTYTPNAGFVGTDDFFYRPYDTAQGGLTRVTINVIPPPEEVNGAPVPTAQAIDIMMDQRGVTRIMPNDPNTFDVHTYTIVDAPENGMAEMLPTGILTYMPDMDFMGDDSVTVRVTDLLGETGEVVVPITVNMMSMMAPAGLFVQCPPDEDGIDTDGDGIVDNDNVCMTLTAGDGFSVMADGQVQYIFSFKDVTDVEPEMVMMEGMMGAELPAPPIEIKEGQRFYLSLFNVGMAARPDLFDPHSVHFHGFPQAAAVFDGVPDSSVSINMGGTFTYYYQLNDPGTYIYHCHVEATEHMQMGMLGSLWVTPKQNGTEYEYPPDSGRMYTQFAYNDGDGSTGFDVDYPILLESFDPNFHNASVGIEPLPFALMDDKYAMINGRGYPDTINPNPLPAPDDNGGKVSQKVSALVTASQGQRILLRLANLSVTEFFTLASPSIPMEVVGVNAKQLRSTGGENLYYTTSSVTLGGGESMDVIMDTQGVGPGTYVLHTTNLNFLSNNDEDFGGLMTEVVITE